jgi:hypothetical protein
MHRFLRLAQNSSLLVCIFALTAAALVPARSQVANLDIAPPPLAPERAWHAEAVSPAADDGTELFRTLYGIKADGWLGTPLKIEPLRITSATGKAPVPETASASPQTGSEALQLLSEFGATEYGQRTFSRGQRRITVSVYRFETSDGAYGAYLTFRQGSSTMVLKGDATSQDDKSVSFWKDRYFVSVVGAPDDEESMLVVTRFASELAIAIKSSSREPQILGRIPSLERLRGSEKIVMGPLGIRRVFSAPFVNALCTEKIVTGVVADYKMQEPDRERVKLLLVRFASPEFANKAYVSYLGALEEQHKAQSFDNYVPQSNLFKVSGSYLLVRLKADEVLVITGARKKSSLPSLAHGVY